MLYAERGNGQDFDELAESACSGTEKKQVEAQAAVEPKEHPKAVEMSGNSITINEISRLIKPELKALFAREAFTTKAIIAAWEKFQGDQVAIINSIVGINEKEPAKMAA